MYTLLGCFTYNKFSENEIVFTNGRYNMCSILLSCTAQYITFRIRVASWVSIS